MGLAHFGFNLDKLNWWFMKTTETLQTPIHSFHLLEQVGAHILWVNMGGVSADI